VPAIAEFREKTLFMRKICWTFMLIEPLPMMEFCRKSHQVIKEDKLDILGLPSIKIN